MLWGLRELSVRGWPTAISEELVAIYNRFRVMYDRFDRWHAAYGRPEFPRVFYALASPLPWRTDDGGEPAKAAEYCEAPEDLRSRDSELREWYTGESADRIFSPFEDEEVLMEINAAASRLIELIWNECAPWAAANGRPPEAPADGPELVGSVAPSGNGTDPPVVLGGPDEEVIVWGTSVGPLPDAEYRVIRVLSEAYAKGERLSTMILKNRTKDARGNVVENPVGTLDRLCAKKDTPWKRAIGMSGKARVGYALNAPPFHRSRPNKPPTKTQ